MRQGVLHRSRYSPGNMDRESLEAVFVGRDDVMEDVLSRVSASIRGPEKHYILLVGPRGSGKTHLLVLAYHRLMASFDEDGVGDSVAIAVLKEEEWGVASYLDLTVRILRALAEDAPKLNAKIAEVYDTFSKDPVAAESCAARLLWRHTEGKTLLLLCENLVDLFHGLGDEGQKRWRAAIQEDGNWAIVATTPQLFAALTLQDNPFYGFFTIRALEQIDLETGIDLLAKKAVHEGKPDLADFLHTPIGRARARAVHHLAAGNHRAYVVLFDFLDKESLKDLVGPFMQMVDHVTPYYQGKMRQIPPAQRKIIEFLCLKGTPATVKDISTSCLMSQQTAAKQIGELVRVGFVNRNRLGRNTFCELSEPLMRICIEVKDNKTRHLRLFVEFLRHWFTSRELERRRAADQRDAPLAVLDRLHVDEALSCSLAERQEPFLDALHDEAQRCWDAGDYAGLATIQEALARDGGDVTDYRSWVYALIEAGDSQAAIAAGREALARHPEDGGVYRNLSEAYFLERQFDNALAAIDHSIAHGAQPSESCLRANILLRLRRFGDAIEEAETMLEVEPDHWHGFSQIMEGLVGLGRVADAEACARDLVQRAPSEPGALLVAARFHDSQGQLSRALELVDRVLAVDADDGDARQLRGSLLFDMAKYRSAAVELRQHASRHAGSVRTQCQLATSLLLSGEFTEAIEVAEHLLEIDPKHDHAHLVRGRALDKLGRSQEAMSAFDELLRTVDYPSLLWAASYFRRKGEFEAAERYLDRVAVLDPHNRELWIQRSRLYIDHGAIDEAMNSAARVETLPGSSLLGRLLAAEAIAAGRPLGTALETIGVCVDAEDFKRNEELHREATVAILTRSVRNFGARYLPEGLVRLRYVFASLVHEGILGGILTDLLIHDISRFAGSVDEWETALGRLNSSLADLPGCRIPLGMLHAAVTFTKTGDERQLLRLPLEQRQLLEEVLPPLGYSHRVFV
ncbi:MAG: tetratricopeptide repeat protein [Bryobacterales bacterium]|nr:tetratricopeptide repeat protein [Bryobacterales bacterium]